MTSQIYYAIGDIHGEYEKLLRVYDLIHQTHEKEFSNHVMHIVHLGDYVDRGPQSFDVVRKLIDLEQDATIKTTSLKGNHELMMLDALDGHDNLDRDDRALLFWLHHGGDATLRSYYENNLRYPPKAHFEWMRNLKSYHWDEAAKLIFVHAGINPHKFPNDGIDTHLWTRTERFFDSESWPDTLPPGTKVIHGHTPTLSERADVTKNYKRINVDTGACYGGPLTVAILAAELPPRFLSI